MSLAALCWLHGTSFQEISTSRTISSSSTACTREQTRVKSGVVKLCSCSSNENPNLLRRSFFYRMCSSPSLAVHTSLLGHPSHSLSSLDETAHFLIVGRNTRRSWQKQACPHCRKRSVAPTAQHSASAGETALCWLLVTSNQKMRLLRTPDNISCSCVASRKNLTLGVSLPHV
jgi:hypothetical protein